MGQGKDGFLDVGLGHPVGAVFVALPPLVLHHVALDFKRILVQGVQQEAHPVRLQPQGQFQVVGWNVFPVVGAVGVGGAVEVGAHLLQRFKVAAVVVAGTLEHHVLEQVGKAGAAGHLVLGTNVVPHVDRRQRD